MGSGRWSGSDFNAYAARHTTGRTTAQVFSQDRIDQALDPLKFTMRESRDSEDNPQSNAIIIGLDITGSMSVVLDSMARVGLNTLVTEIYNRKPVTDPHIMCLGIGDIECDGSPIQATQFEADIRIAEQLRKIYLEGGGGGNDHESYALAWYLAAACTSIDCMEKRNKKGYLFTVGDECPTPRLLVRHIQRVMKVCPQTDLTGAEALEMARRKYHVYHVIVAEGSFARDNMERVRQEWTHLLGQKALVLTHHQNLAELIVSAIQVNEGASIDDVIGSWSGPAQDTVRRSLRQLRV